MSITKIAIQRYFVNIPYLYVAGESDVYGRIDVSKPAILGGRVTFTLTLNRTCSQQYWQYPYRNTNQVFHYEENTIDIGEFNNTFTLTLINAMSTYHKTNISFYCDSDVPLDTVRLDLIGKQKHHKVCMSRK